MIKKYFFGYQKFAPKFLHNKSIKNNEKALTIIHLITQLHNVYLQGYKKLLRHKMSHFLTKSTCSLSFHPLYPYTPTSSTVKYRIQYAKCAKEWKRKTSNLDIHFHNSIK